MSSSNCDVVEFQNNLKNFSSQAEKSSKSQESDINEEETKTKLIIPLLKMLGWDENKDIKHEYGTEQDKSQSRVDLALFNRKVSQEPLLLVEVKSFKTKNLSDYSGDAIKYGKERKVRWVALSNGKTVMLFDTIAEEKESFIAEINLDTYFSTNFSKLYRLISKDAISTDKINKEIKEIKEWQKAKQNAEEILKQTEDEFMKRLDDLVIKNTNIKQDELEIESFENMLNSRFESIRNDVYNIIEKDDYEGVSKDKLKAKYRDELSKRAENVIVCPSRRDSVDFLKKYNVWGYIEVSEEKVNEIKYFALYVTDPYKEILYFGEVYGISNKLETKDDDIIKFIDDSDKNTFAPGKRLICLKPGTIVRFKDPISGEKSEIRMQNCKYTSLNRLLNAESLNDLF